MPIAYPYKFSDWYGYDKDCVVLTGFLAGSGQSGSSGICNQLSSQVTYYHNGSGTNWPYFPSGPQPPDGWFRITGSTGTVQSQSNCP